MATQYSNSKQLTVFQVQPDDRAGWRYEAVDIENGTVLINDWSVAKGDFQQIMNGVGRGAIFLPKGDPVIEEALRQGGTKKAVLVRAYLDGLFRYGFFLEDKKDVVDDNLGTLVRFSGKGMESIAADMLVRPKDYPNIPAKVETWIYGSNANLIENADLTDGELPENPYGADGNDGDGNVKGWSTKGDVDVYKSVQDPGNGYLGRDFYIEVDTSAHHSGIKQSIPCEPGKVYGVEVRLREPGNNAQRYTLALGGATDLSATGTYPNNYEYNNEILAELDNVARNGAGNGCPGGASDGTWQVLNVEVTTGKEQTSLEITIQHDHHPSCGDLDGSYPKFQVGDVTVDGFGLNLDGWEPFDLNSHASNSFRRDSTTVYPGSLYSMRINPLDEFAGTEQLVAVDGSQKYRAFVRAYIGTAQAGDNIQVEYIDTDGTTILAKGTTALVSGSWVQASTELEMPSDQEEVYYRVTYEGPNNPGPIYLSEFTVVPGEPAATPGKLLSDLITPIQARGTHDYLNLDFDTVSFLTDSAGQPWASTIAIDVQTGSSILQVLNRLVALGYEWRIAPTGYADGGGSSGFNLEVWNSREIDSTSGMGVDLTGDSDPVIYAGDAVTGGDERTQTRRPNVVYVQGKDGYWTEVFQDDYSSYEAVVGRLEAHIQVSDVTDQNTLADFGRAYLVDEKDRESGVRLRFTRTDSIRPYRDFRVGDSIFVDLPPDIPDPDRATARRVRAIQVTTEGEGTDVGYAADFDRVTYKDDAAVLALVAQLTERSPTDTTGTGTGSVSASGSVTTITDGGTVGPHTHALEDLTNQVLSGDVSGKVSGLIRVNALKGIPVDTTIPAEVTGQTTYLQYDRESATFALGQDPIVSAIDDLSDVDTSTVAPTNGQALVWDNAAAQWEPGDVAAGGGGGGSTVGAEVRRTSSQTAFASSTWEDVEWQAEEYDDNGFWEGVTNPERITFAEVGRYLVVANVIFTGAATGQRFLRAVRNASDTNEIAIVGPIEAFSGDERGILSFIVDAAANDYVRIQGYSSSGSTQAYGQGTAGDDLETSRLQVVRLATSGRAYGRMYPTADQGSIGSGGVTVAFDTADGSFPTSVVDLANNRFVAPWAGRFRLTFTPSLLSTVSDQRIYAVVNGTDYSPVPQFMRFDADSARLYHGSISLDLAANDQVTIRYESHGGTQTIRGATVGQRAFAEFEEIG